MKKALQIETNESIRIEFDLAGIGSRAVAALLDHLIILVILAAILLLFLGIKRILPLEEPGRDFQQVISNVATALLVISWFLIIVGYFLFFETRYKGKTPGKRIAGIRVIKDDGSSPGAKEAAIRTFFRPVDFLPMGYFLAMMSAIISNRGKRLGDLAAGTVVIRSPSPAGIGLTSIDPAQTRLIGLLDKADQVGTSMLNANEMDEIVLLHREICAMLSRAKENRAGIKNNDQLVLDLNRLAARSHSIIDPSKADRQGAALEFLRTGFPRLVRKTGVFHIVSAAFLFIPFLTTLFVVSQRPQYSLILAPELSGVFDSLDRMYGDFNNQGRPPGLETAMASFYVTNNTRVALMCFCFGIFFGLGTLLVLFFNGLYLGAITGLVHTRGLQFNLLSFVAAHGPLEITGIVLAGGAGLMIGYALLEPTNLPRSEHLASRGRDAVMLVAGAAFFIALAAPIEAFVSSSSMPGGFKIGLGTINLALVILHLVLSGRHSWTDAKNGLNINSRQAKGQNT
ncbi:MAG: hypothetical protein GXP49_02620 [Deltaproteobacteria bacterium]|nr:hypothetical protein [Deltaproteobacteria bacterium]